MRKSLTFVALSLFMTAGVFAQSFECHPVGALPTDPSVSCDGVAASNAFCGVSNSPVCAFPTNGAKYIFIWASWNWVTSEVRIGIPAGSTLVTFDWEFFNSECPSDPSFNDGFAVSVVDPAGNLLQSLAYADTYTPEGPCAFGGQDYCGGPVREVLPAGANTVAAALNPFPICSYLSIACWNGGDNMWPSLGFIDNVTFNGGGPVCPPPCFIVNPSLTFSSPSGAGCIQANMMGLPANGSYILAVTFTAGAYPHGWLYGIDISLNELANEINTGFPFVGPVTGCGGFAQVGEFCNLPSGLNVYAVAFGIPAGQNYASVATNPASYTIP